MLGIPGYYYTIGRLSYKIVTQGGTHRTSPQATERLLPGYRFPSNGLFQSSQPVPPLCDKLWEKAQPWWNSPDLSQGSSCCSSRMADRRGHTLRECSDEREVLEAPEGP